MDSSKNPRYYFDLRKERKNAVKGESAYTPAVALVAFCGQVTFLVGGLVLAGLSLFLSLFIMGPVLSKVNSAGIQPYLHGTKTRSQAWTDGMAPLRTFMPLGLVAIVLIAA